MPTNLKNNILNKIILTSVLISSFLTFSTVYSETIYINLFSTEKYPVNLIKLSSNHRNKIQHELLWHYTDATRGIKIVKANEKYFIQSENVIIQINKDTFIGVSPMNFPTNLNDQDYQYYRNFRNAMFLTKYRNSQPRPTGIRK